MVLYNIFRGISHFVLHYLYASTTLEYFERMLPSYNEYEREKYSKNYESESELLVQEFKPVTLQQDDIDVDIIGQGKRILIDDVWALYYNI